MKSIKPWLAAILLSAGASVPVQAQTPAPAPAADDAPIKLVVPFAPGGSTDLVARLIAEKAGRLLGTTMVVDNRAGASGNIGSAFVAKSAPDGKTLLLNGTAPLSIGMASGRPLGFDPIKDLAPIGIVTELPNIVAVNAALPIRSVAELVAYGKANPGKLNYGMSGIGNLSQFNAEMFAAAAGIQLVGAAYKGSAPMLTDLIGGTIQVSFDNLPPFLPHVESGRLRALAVTSARRSAALPNVPALSEVGFPSFDHPARFAIFGPAGLPAKTVQRYNEALGRALSDPEVVQKLRAAAIDAAPSSPEQLAARLVEERDAFARVIQTAGIKFE